MDAVHEAGGIIYAQVGHIVIVHYVNLSLPPFFDSSGMVGHPQNPSSYSTLIYFSIVGRVSHPDAPEQKLAGTVSTLKTILDKQANIQSHTVTACLRSVRDFSPRWKIPLSSRNPRIRYSK